jgi:hypothetical protein
VGLFGGARSRCLARFAVARAFFSNLDGNFSPRAATVRLQCFVRLLFLQRWHAPANEASGTNPAIDPAESVIILKDFVSGEGPDKLQM